MLPIVLVLFLHEQAVSKRTGIQLLQVNENGYFAYDSPKVDYLDSLTQCNNVGGFIAMPKDPTANDAAATACESLLDSSVECYIGFYSAPGFDHSDPANWAWADGQSGAELGFDKWGSSQPNEVIGNAACSRYMKTQTFGFWYDNKCTPTTNIGRVCQYAKEYDYVPHEISIDYNGAVSTCASEGGKLVSIHSKILNDVIFDLCPTTSCWIGLTDVDGDNTYSWDDGSDLDFSFWDLNDVNTLPCVRTSGGGDWRKADCGASSYPYVCQIGNPTPGPTSVPTPVPTALPTPSVSVTPTFVPTEVPSPSPTPVPTTIPAHPTSIPTINVSAQPSTSPTGTPETLSPTSVPTTGVRIEPLPTATPSSGLVPLPSPWPVGQGPTPGSTPHIEPTNTPTSSNLPTPAIYPTTETGTPIPAHEPASPSQVPVPTQGEEERGEEEKGKTDEGEIGSEIDEEDEETDKQQISTFCITCTDTTFSCDNGCCIHQTYECDGQDACGDMSDEQNCDEDTSNNNAGAQTLSIVIPFIMVFVILCAIVVYIFGRKYIQKRRRVQKMQAENEMDKAVNNELELPHYGGGNTGGYSSQPYQQQANTGGNGGYQQTADGQYGQSQQDRYADQGQYQQQGGYHNQEQQYQQQSDYSGQQSSGFQGDPGGQRGFQDQEPRMM